MEPTALVIGHLTEGERIALGLGSGLTFGLGTASGTGIGKRPRSSNRLRYPAGRTFVGDLGLLPLFRT